MDIKKIVLLAITILFLCACDRKDFHEFEFDILCQATQKLTYSSINISCQFYFFEPGEYISIEKDDFMSSGGTYGKAIATKTDGTIVESVGYAIYFSSENRYGRAKYRNNQKEIREGTFYVACFPDRSPGRHFPYKAKIFTKERNSGLIIQPVFTEYSLRADGYKRFEWDE